ARTHIDIDRRIGVGDGDYAGNVAVRDQHDAAAKRAQLRDQFLVAGPVEHADDDVGGLDALLGGDGADILARRLGEVDDAVRITGAYRDLVHIDVRRVEEAAFLGNGEHRERVGPRLGGDGGAFQRIERDVDLGAFALRGANLLADEEHRGLVTLTLADDDSTVHVQRVERGAHRL